MNPRRELGLQDHGNTFRWRAHSADGTDYERKSRLNPQPSVIERVYSMAGMELHVITAGRSSASACPNVSCEFTKLLAGPEPRPGHGDPSRR